MNKFEVTVGVPKNWTYTIPEDMPVLRDGVPSKLTPVTIEVETELDNPTDQQIRDLLNMDGDYDMSFRAIPA